MKSKTLILTALLGTAFVSRGDMIFTEDFNGQSFDNTSGVPQVFGGATPDVAVGEWFGASNYVAINNEIQFSDPGSTNRGRGAAIWLDSSAWIPNPGIATVTFDILDYGGSGEAVFQAYYANGVDGSSSVSFDLTTGQQSLPATAVTGSATIGTIGDRHTITANATQAEFTFNYTGQENIALVFWNRNQQTWSVDNLSVATAVPEPSALALLGAGLGALMAARRRKALT